MQWKHKHMKSTHLNWRSHSPSSGRMFSLSSKSTTSNESWDRSAEDKLLPLVSKTVSIGVGGSLLVREPFFLKKIEFLVEID